MCSYTRILPFEGLIELPEWKRRNGSQRGGRRGCVIRLARCAWRSSRTHHPPVSVRGSCVACGVTRMRRVACNFPHVHRSLPHWTAVGRSIDVRRGFWFCAEPAYSSTIRKLCLLFQYEYVRVLRVDRVRALIKKIKRTSITFSFNDDY